MLRRRSPAQESFRAQVFVEVWPVDAIAATAIFHRFSCSEVAWRSLGYQMRSALITLLSFTVTLSESDEKRTPAMRTSVFNAKMSILPPDSTKLHSFSYRHRLRRNSDSCGLRERKPKTQERCFSGGVLEPRGKGFGWKRPGLPNLERSDSTKKCVFSSHARIQAVGSGGFVLRKRKEKAQAAVSNRKSTS